jgi:hypothetical protein
MSSTVKSDIHRMVMAALSEQDPAREAAAMNQALRLMSKWRSALIQNAIVKKLGTAVQSGPLRGLDFLPGSAEGCHIAKLLGTYEQPLHPYIEAAVDAAYAIILNIGCAEGYYAVGMARRMQDTRVLAYDSNPDARKICAGLAAKNNVAERITIGALFNPEDFLGYAGQRALVLCDIEGGEKDLLDPAKSTALAHMDIIAESHDGSVPGVTGLLKQRFEKTHDITVVEDDGMRSAKDVPDWFRNLAHLDQLLAIWEWRTAPTPWLVMKAKEPAGNPRPVQTPSV